jgi:hypothetical protein
LDGFQFRLEKREIVIGKHGATHEDQPGRLRQIGKSSSFMVQIGELDGYTVLLEGRPEQTEVLGHTVPKNYRAHGLRVT